MSTSEHWQRSYRCVGACNDSDRIVVHVCVERSHRCACVCTAIVYLVGVAAITSLYLWLHAYVNQITSLNYGSIFIQASGRLSCLLLFCTRVLAMLSRHEVCVFYFMYSSFQTHWFRRRSVFELWFCESLKRWTFKHFKTLYCCVFPCAVRCFLLWIVDCLNIWLFEFLKWPGRLGQPVRPGSQAGQTRPADQANQQGQPVRPARLASQAHQRA